MIPSILIELSKLYFRQLNPEKEHVYEIKQETNNKATLTRHRCSNCLTVYDQEYGDPLSGVEPEVPFEDLPDTYTCHVCDSLKKDFVALHTMVSAG
jgi:rubredoxin